MYSVLAMCKIIVARIVGEDKYEVGGIYNVVCAPLVALFSRQWATNRVAMNAHCSISPTKYGSLSMFDCFQILCGSV